MSRKEGKGSLVLIMFLVSVLAVGCGVKADQFEDGGFKGKSTTESVYLL